MKLRDGHIRWMQAYGVTSIDFDPDGNVLRVQVAPKSLDGSLECPAPEEAKPMTRAEQNKISKKAKELRDAYLYAHSEGLPDELSSLGEADNGEA
jgi:hypothetical protein